MSILKRLFKGKGTTRGESPDSDTTSLSFQSNNSQPADANSSSPDHMLPVRTSSEYQLSWLKTRRDPAISTWRKSAESFTPIPMLDCRPICPNCNESLGKRKPPSRRSKVSCKQCGELVFIDPRQQVFPSVYLTERQGLIAESLGLLDASPAGAGTNCDFWWAASQLNWTKGKALLSDAEARDALWRLIHYSKVSIETIIPPDERDYLRDHSTQLDRLSFDFRDKYEALKVKKKRPSASGKIEQVCPYCGDIAGFVPKPSRASARKCKACGNSIQVVPTQPLYPTPFLTEAHTCFVRYLNRLSGCVYTQGSIEEFHSRAERQTLAPPYSDEAVAGILQEMIQYNLDNVETINSEDAKRDQESRSILGSDSGEGFSMIRVYREEIEEILKSFEKDMAELGIDLE